MLVGLCLLLAMSLHAFSHSRTQAEGAHPVGDVLHSWPREKNKNQSHTMQFSLRLLLRRDICHVHVHAIGQVQYQWGEKVCTSHMRHCKSLGSMGGVYNPFKGERRASPWESVIQSTTPCPQSSWTKTSSLTSCLCSITLTLTALPRNIVPRAPVPTAVDMTLSWWFGVSLLRWDPLYSYCHAERNENYSKGISTYWGIRGKKFILLLGGVNLAGQILRAVDSSGNLGTDPTCSGHKSASQILLHPDALHSNLFWLRLKVRGSKEPWILLCIRKHFALERTLSQWAFAFDGEETGSSHQMGTQERSRTILYCSAYLGMIKMEFWLSPQLVLTRKQSLLIKDREPRITPVCQTHFVLDLHMKPLSSPMKMRLILSPIHRPVDSSKSNFSLLC